MKAQRGDGLVTHEAGLAAHEDGLAAHEDGLAAHEDDLATHEAGLTAYEAGFTAHEAGCRLGGALAEPNKDPLSINPGKATAFPLLGGVGVGHLRR